MSTESLDRPNSPTLQDLAQIFLGPGWRKSIVRGLLGPLGPLGILEPLLPQTHPGNSSPFTAGIGSLGKRGKFPNL